MQRTVERGLEQRERRAKRSSPKSGDVWRYIALVTLALVTLAPIFVMFATSLKLPVEIQSRVPRWIFMPTVSNYTEVITTYRMIPYLISSLVIAVGSTFFTLLTAGMAAFALARMRFPGRGIIAQTTLVIRMIPPAVIAVAVIGFWISWGIGDAVEGVRFSLPNGLGRGDLFDGSQLGLMLFYTALNLPFSVVALVRFYPADSGGARRSRHRRRCELAASFVSRHFPAHQWWLRGLRDLHLSHRLERVYLSALLDEPLHQNAARLRLRIHPATAACWWGEMMAVGSLIAIPPLIITFFAAKQIIQGMTAGAVKG